MENGKGKQKAVPVKADDADDAGRSSRTCRVVLASCALLPLE